MLLISMQIHEFQAKTLLKQSGLASSPFQVIASCEEVLDAVAALGGGPLLVTPQIHGPRTPILGQDEQDIKNIVEKMLGQDFEGRIAHRIMLSKNLVFSHLEKLVWTLEEKPHSHAYSPELDHFFVAHDLTRMELLLGTTEEGHVYVADADLHVDKKALYRQKELVEFFDSTQMTAQDLYAAHYGFFYQEYKGLIGCLTSGRGLGQKTINQITELGGSVSALVALQEEASRYALEGAIKMLSFRSRALLINLFPEVMNAEVWACFLASCLKDKKISVVVRLIGEKKDAARALLAKYPRMDVIDDLEEAARTAIIRAGLL